MFSFCSPLDQKFLASIVKSAGLKNIEYISPFWTTYFFGYLDYNPNIAHLSCNQLSAMVNKVAANIVAILLCRYVSNLNVQTTGFSA